MGILYDLANLNLENIKIKDFEVLNSRDVYPIINAGKIKGFVDNDGVTLIMY